MRYVLLALITIGMMTYAVIDCVRTDDSRIRLGLPHWFWVATIILLPFAGALLWLIVAGVNRRKYEDGPSARPQRPKGPLAPDDDPDFLFRLERDRRRAQQERDASAAAGRPPAGPANPPAAPVPPPSDTSPVDPPDGTDDRDKDAGDEDDDLLYVPEEFSVPDFLGEGPPADPGPPQPESPDDADDGQEDESDHQANDQHGDENGRR